MKYNVRSFYPYMIHEANYVGEFRTNIEAQKVRLERMIKFHKNKLSQVTVENQLEARHDLKKWEKSFTELKEKNMEYFV